MKADYIIVGNGLAGACLAVQLHTLGKKLVVYDIPSDNKSSAVAAGLYNPITGKVMRKTWQAAVLFPYLHRFYREAEHLLQRSFFHPVGIYRPFITAGEQNDWAAWSANPDDGVPVELTVAPQSRLAVNDPLGGLLLPTAGWVDVASFLNAVRSLLSREHRLVEEPFRYDAVRLAAGVAHYGDIVAEKIICCEGVGARNNPWLAPLPIQPLKGEVLIVEAALPEAPIVNRGVYLVPHRQPGCFKAGATYNPHDQQPTVTNQARQDLERHLKAILRIPFRVCGQEWGFRPTVPDRRPIVGQHPRLEQILVFNGLGTKGVSLAPYFSHTLAQWLAGKQSLPHEANMNRFYPLYSN